MGKGFVYFDNDLFNESCQNNSKLHPNKKSTNLFSKNILTSQDVIKNASIDTKDVDKIHLIQIFVILILTQ